MFDTKARAAFILPYSTSNISILIGFTAAKKRQIKSQFPQPGIFRVDIRVGIRDRGSILGEND